MYESSQGPEPGGCRETLLLIRIAFAVLLPPLLAIGGVVVLLFLFFVLFSLHPLFGLLPFAIGAVVLFVLARRERGRGVDQDQPRRPH